MGYGCQEAAVHLEGQYPSGHHRCSVRHMSAAFGMKAADEESATLILAYGQATATTF